MSNRRASLCAYASMIYMGMGFECIRKMKEYMICTIAQLDCASCILLFVLKMVFNAIVISLYRGGVIMKEKGNYKLIYSRKIPLTIGEVRYC